MPPAPRNRSLTLTEDDIARIRPRLLRIDAQVPLAAVLDRTVCQDCTLACQWLPSHSIDLLFLDPPYNLNKTFGGRSFRRIPAEQYANQLEQWLAVLMPLLKPTATVYVCSEWGAGMAVQSVLDRHFFVRNRITWEREKGRGAQSNWKNCSEDIWFCTVSTRYTFNIDAVRLKRKVVAPYTNADGQPRGWHDGYRRTCPSNLWTDISVPFWSMPENTAHPAQKAEKLLAKLILASTNPRDVMLDPFMGSGTASVVAKKLGRHFIGIEIDDSYGCLAEKRLELADLEPSIQGYEDGVFWERNSRPRRKRQPDREH